MKIALILPIIFCLFFNKKNTPSVFQPVLSAEKWERLENFENFLNVNSNVTANVNTTACQKTIQFDMLSVTTVRKNPKPIWQQRKEGIKKITEVSNDNMEEFTEHSQLDICVSATGDCQWKVSNKRGKSPVYSPLSIYVVSCLRQLSGDYGALPEQIVNDMRTQGSSVQSIGNQTIVVKTPRHPTNGQFGMMIMDTSRCAFLGSSLYNSEDRLQFKVIYNYATNDETGERFLASATLITNDFEHKTTTETTTFFTKK